MSWNYIPGSLVRDSGCAGCPLAGLCGDTQPPAHPCDDADPDPADIDPDEPTPGDAGC